MNLLTRRFLATGIAAILIGESVLAQTSQEARPPSQEMAFGMGPPTTPELVQAVSNSLPPIPAGPYEPNWDSIRANYRVPQWFIDAKFGITMHWGLYSVPAHHNEWYAKHMYGNKAISEWHAAKFGTADKFGYKDFIPLFKAEKFDPDAWAALCKEAGAQYVMPTAEHHDGFSLWDSAHNPFNSVKMGPKRDIMGDLATAVRKQGMRFGICDHSIENYTFIAPRAVQQHDLADPAYQDFYWFKKNDEQLQKFLARWANKTLEYIDKYQPDIIWFDNGANSRVYDPLKLKIAAYYYNRAKEWNKEVTLDTKGACFTAGAVQNFEKMVRGPRDIHPGIWEAEEPIGSTWGYTTEETFRSPQAIVNLLCDIVSKNGNLLLNLSPDGNGVISEPQQRTLRELGKWLKVNGEAIYGTHAWTRFSDTDSATQYRFTVKGQNLYAIALNWPGTTATIPCLTKSGTGVVSRVTLLGNDGDLKFKQDADGLTMQLPDKPGNYAFVFKIEGLKLNPPGEPLPAKPIERPPTTQRATTQQNP